MTTSQLIRSPRPAAIGVDRGVPSVKSSVMFIVFQLSQKWTKLERPEGAYWPVGRHSHAACCLNYGEDDPQLLVTGGVYKNNTTLKDAWVLDINSARWTEVRDCVCLTDSEPSTILIGYNTWLKKS